MKNVNTKTQETKAEIEALNATETLSGLFSLGSKIEERKRAEYAALTKEEKAERHEKAMAAYDRRTANVSAEITDVEFFKSKNGGYCTNDKNRLVFKHLVMEFTWDTVNDLKEPVHQVVKRDFDENSTNFLYFVIINTIIDNMKTTSEERKLLWNTTETSEGVLGLVNLFNRFKDKELFTLDVGLRPGTYDIAKFTFEYTHR